MRVGCRNDVCISVDGKKTILLSVFLPFDVFKLCEGSYAIEHTPKTQALELHSAYSAFERQRGDRSGVEEAIYTKKRFEYEEILAQNPRNYDTWFDLTRLEESYAEADRIREVYERAIAHTPPPDEKRFWRRYAETLPPSTPPLSKKFKCTYIHIHTQRQSLAMYPL